METSVIVKLEKRFAEGKKIRKVGFFLKMSRREVYVKIFGLQEKSVQE
jgi:hypothetical protein